MLAKPAPTDQRAAVRPISFVLDDAGTLSPPVTLTIRPEDLRRTEQLRATVHQTLGREVSGWVDSFGEGLPTLTISGHTGWRYSDGNGMDGAQHFAALNQLVAHDFPEAQQSAVERGIDPALVKLLFIDMLDGFAYTVLPTSFVLQRNKNRPLLIQYNINMQAIATGIDFPAVVVPDYGGVPAGLQSLDAATIFLEAPGFDLGLMTAGALSTADLSLSPLADLLARLIDLTTSIFREVALTLRAATSSAVGLADPIVTIAAALASAGANIYHAVAAIPLIPVRTRAQLGRVGTRYAELVCIFQNSLRGRTTYEDYEPLYGASGCSSTTGGRPRSVYEGRDVFALMQVVDEPMFSGDALASISALATFDPVLSPMAFTEIGRHVNNVLDGVTL